MVEMVVVIYDKSNTEHQWFKVILSFPQFLYMIENCTDLSETYDFLNMLGQWKECEEPDE